MSAEKCPECGAWWAWPSEHRCPPIISTNTASIAALHPGFVCYSHYVQDGQQDEDAPPVVSLCGKVWTPSRNPDAHPRCPECTDLVASMGGWVA